MTRLRQATSRTFSALRHRNYRLYFAAQIASFSGMWMQTVGLAWLVLQLTGSGVALGVITALQFAPMLALGPVAGVVADRFDKRRLVMTTQAAAGTLALVLAVLTATDVVELWMIGVLAFALGVVTAVDNPARQTFVHEMVGPEDLANAISLGTVVFNASRVVGPAIAGVLIATSGIAPTFFANAGSYAAVVLALAVMNTAALYPTERAPREKGQLRAGLRYAWQTPAVRTPLLMMAIIGTLAYEFQVTLPLLARYTFEGGAGTYGAITAVIGGGAVVGGLVIAGRGAPTGRRVAGSALAFGVLTLVVAAMPTLPSLFAVLPFLGAASIAFIARANASLQLAAAPSYRGRVMSLWSMAFLGSTFVGAPIVGWVAEAMGARAAIALGGLATIPAALWGWRVLAAEDAVPDGTAPAVAA